MEIPFIQKLETVLKQDERLIADNGQLLKNKAVEFANKLDENLVKILHGDKELKETFFKKVGDLILFDKDLFVEFVSNKEFLPDSYTAFKNKIGLAVGRDYLKQDKEVALVWPYKDCVLEGGQTKEEAKRGEIFWNTTLAPDEINRLLEPKVLTNWTRYDKDNAKKGRRATEISDTDNLIIKGNNLIALHSLKKRYAGRIKLIYIDPPYNTGNDTFKYNDGFNHSTWLTFMRNRLEVAKELLSEDGSIFVQIDHNESHYLKVLMDEIFKRENFRNEIVWKRSQNVSSIGNIFKRSHDIIFFYAKSQSTILNKVYREQDEKYLSQYKFSDENGQYRHAPLLVSGKRTGSTGTPWKGIDPNELGKSGMHWITTREKLEALDKKGLIYWPSKGGQPMLKYYLDANKGAVVSDVWDDIGLISPTSNEALDFTGQKPEELLMRIIESVTKPDDLVLDYHAGTGTTGAVAHKMKRQYILIEQMDYIRDLPEARLKNVIAGEQTGISKSVNWQGGGSFVYAELMPLNEKFVREIENAKSTKEVLKIWEAIQKNGFVSYRVDPKKFDESTKEFADLDLAKQKKFVLESLDANMLYVNYGDIDDKEYAVSADDKKLNKEFYGNAPSRI